MFACAAKNCAKTASIVSTKRLDTLATHPIFGYRISRRRVLEVQARLLGRALLGEIPRYAGFCTR